MAWKVKDDEVKYVLLDNENQSLHVNYSAQEVKEVLSELMDEEGTDDVDDISYELYKIGNGRLEPARVEVTAKKVEFEIT